MLARPGDPDVQQPPLLLDGLGGVGVRDRQHAVDEPDEQDRVPLQALGRVQRGQRDSLDRGCVLRRGRARPARRPARRGPPPARRRRARWASPTSAFSDSQRSRTAPEPAGGCADQPDPASTSWTCPTSPRPRALPVPSADPSAGREESVASSAALAAPRSSTTASRTSGRSKNRSAPRSTYGIPASASASSNTSDCALTRYRTATSLAGVPASSSARIRPAAAAASAGSSGCAVNVGSGPGGRWATSCTPAADTASARARADARSRPLASPTTCGVER